MRVRSISICGMPFFLEGLEKFNFGGSHDGDPLQEIVHTRTIVDPLAGLKLNGRIGEKNTVALIYAMDELPDTEKEDYAHFSIFRYKRALSKDSFIGGIYTGRERKSSYNRVMGTDGQLRINQSSIFGYHIFESLSQANDEIPKEDGHALGLHYLYNTRDWILMLGLPRYWERLSHRDGVYDKDRYYPDSIGNIADVLSSIKDSPEN